jgi:hypothetical protein
MMKGDPIRNILNALGNPGDEPLDSRLQVGAAGGATVGFVMQLFLGGERTAAIGALIGAILGLCWCAFSPRKPPTKSD